MQLAARVGIWANPQFPFPRKLIDTVMLATLGHSAAQPNGYEPTSMLFSIAALLRESLDDARFDEVKRYLGDDTRRQQLNRYLLSQLPMPGQINRAHAAVAQRLKQFVRADVWRWLRAWRSCSTST